MQGATGEGCRSAPPARVARGDVRRGPRGRLLLARPRPDARAATALLLGQVVSALAAPRPPWAPRRARGLAGSLGRRRAGGPPGSAALPAQASGWRPPGLGRAPLARRPVCEPVDRWASAKLDGVEQTLTTRDRNLLGGLGRGLGRLLGDGALARLLALRLLGGRLDDLRRRGLALDGGLGLLGGDDRLGGGRRGVGVLGEGGGRHGCLRRRASTAWWRVDGVDGAN